jgi:hypothetical protein
MANSSKTFPIAASITLLQALSTKRLSPVLLKMQRNSLNAPAFSLRASRYAAYRYSESLVDSFAFGLEIKRASPKIDMSAVRLGLRLLLSDLPLKTPRNFNPIDQAPPSINIISTLVLIF